MMTRKNQVTTLVLEAMDKKQLSRLNLIKKMGYSSVNKGLRRLDLFLNCEDLNPIFVAKLTDALGLDTEVMNQAINEDKRIKRAPIEEQRRKDFKPYIYLKTYETRPSSYFSCGMSGGSRKHKMIFVSTDLPLKPWIEQVAVVQALVKEHYQATKGIAAFFGQISGYLYCPTYETSYEFSIHGETDGVNMGRR